MKLRIIAVPVGNEIKKFPNDTWHFFSPRVFCRLSSIMTVLKGKYSFFEKLVIHESAFLVFLIVSFFDLCSFFFKFNKGYAGHT